MQTYGLDQNDYMNLQLFISSESSIYNKSLSLLNSMVELNYVKFDISSNRLALTQLGVDYMDQYSNKIAYYIKKNNMKLSDFGIMACYVAPLLDEINNSFNLMNSDILDYKTNVDVFGNNEPNWNTVIFKNKNGDEPMG